MNAPYEIIEITEVLDDRRRFMNTTTGEITEGESIDPFAIIEDEDGSTESED